jgi:hypothetical protein
MKTKIFLIIATVTLLGMSEVWAIEDITFTSDGVIKEGDEYANVFIYDTPPHRTTVSMFGGWASFIQSYDSSIFNMFGGTAEACAYNQSTFNVGGGTIYTLNSYNSSNVNVFGGQVNHLTAYDTGTVDVWNNGIVGVMRARNSGVVNVGGGILGLISASNFGTVNLLGGVVDDYLAASDSGIINVYGHNLAKVPSGGHYGFGFVSGEWTDGTGFNIDLSGPDTYSRVVLYEIPEPATVLLIAMGSIICLRKRREF